jgi:hypothetical protein
MFWGFSVSLSSSSINSCGMGMFDAFIVGFNRWLPRYTAEILAITWPKRCPLRSSETSYFAESTHFKLVYAALNSKTPKQDK